jgi:hypothetical protein
VRGELRLTNGIRQIADVKCFICHGGSDMQLFRLKSKFFEILETGRESEAWMSVLMRRNELTVPYIQ